MLASRLMKKFNQSFDTELPSIEKFHFSALLCLWWWEWRALIHKGQKCAISRLGVPAGGGSFSPVLAAHSTSSCIAVVVAAKGTAWADRAHKQLLWSGWWVCNFLSYVVSDWQQTQLKVEARRGKRKMCVYTYICACIRAWDKKRWLKCPCAPATGWVCFWGRMRESERADSTTRMESSWQITLRKDLPGTGGNKMQFCLSWLVHKNALNNNNRKKKKKKLRANPFI